MCKRYIISHMKKRIFNIFFVYDDFRNGILDKLVIFGSINNLAILLSLIYLFYEILHYSIGKSICVVFVIYLSVHLLLTAALFITTNTKSALSDDAKKIMLDVFCKTYIGMCLSTILTIVVFWKCLDDERGFLFYTRRNQKKLIAARLRGKSRID